MNLIVGKIRTAIEAHRLKGRLGEALAPAHWMGVIRGRAQADRALEAVETLADGLGAVAGRFEPQFIDLGGQLQTAAEASLQLTEHTRMTVEIINGRSDDNLLGRVEKLAEASLTELKGCRTHMSGSLESINGCLGHLMTLNGHTGIIEKIALILRVIGLNIAVESSRTEAGRSIFGVVAKDVIALSQEIRETVSRLCRHAEEATQIQQEAYREVSNGFKEACKLADGAERSVRDATDDVEKLMGMAVEALENAQRHSNAISEQVGQVVAGIQFHDSMSQRLEHMAAALADLPQLARAQPGGTNGRPGRSERLAEAHAVVALQCGQLGQIISDANAVHRKNKGAFETICLEIDALVKGLTDYAHHQRAGTARGKGETNAFQNLLHAMNDLHALLKQSVTMKARIHRALTEAGTSADNLADQSATVRRISHAIHLLALNGIVRAARMDGGGRTLEVLAQEVRSLSHQANAFVDRYHQLLDDITSASAERQAAGDIMDGPDGLGDLIGEGIEAISSAYSHFQTESQGVVSAAEGLKQRIQAIEADLDFFDELDSALSEHQRQLASIQADLSRWEADRSTASAPLASRMTQRYTMNQERIIHNQVFGASEAEGSPAVAQDVDNGVELFESDAPSGETWPNDADPEGFETVGGTGAVDGDGAAGEAGRSQETFDDNIELF